MSDFEKLRADALAKIDISIKFIEGVSQIDDAKKKFLGKRLGVLREDIARSKCDCKDEITRQSMYNKLKQSVDKALTEIFSSTHSTVFVESDMTYHPINQEMLFMTREQARRIRTLTADVAERDRIIAERNLEIQRLNGLIGTLHQRVARLRHNLDNVRDRNARLLEFNEIMGDTIMLLQTINGNQSIELNNKDYQIGALQNYNEDLHHLLHEAQEENKRLQELNRRLQIYRELYTQSQLDNDDKRQRLVNLDADNKRKDDELKLFEDLLARLRMERDAFGRYVVDIYNYFRELLEENPPEEKDVDMTMGKFGKITEHLGVIMNMLSIMFGGNRSTLVGTTQKLTVALQGMAELKINDSGGGLHTALVVAYKELLAKQQEDKKIYDAAIADAKRLEDDLRANVDRLTAQNNRLIQENGQKQQELEQLRRYIDGQANAIAACMQQLNGTQAELKTCHSENAAKDARIAELQQRIVVLDQEIENYKNLLAEQERKTAYNETFAYIIIQLETMASELKGYGADIDDEKLVDGIRHSVHILIEQNTKLRKMVEGFAKNGNNGPPEVTYASERSDKRLRALQEKLSSKEHEYKLLGEEHKELKDKLEKCDNKLRTLQSRIEKIYADSKSANGLQEIIDEQAARIAKQERDLKKQAEQVEKIHLQNGLQVSLINELQEKNDFLEKHKGDLDKKLKTYDSKMTNRIDLAITYIDELVQETKDFLDTFATNWEDGQAVLVHALRNYHDKIENRINNEAETLTYSKDEDNNVQDNLKNILRYVNELINKINNGIYPPDKKTGSGEQFHHKKTATAYAPRYTGGAVESTTSAVSYLIGLIVLLVIYILYALVAAVLSPTKKKRKVLFVNCKMPDSAIPSKIENAVSIPVA